MAALTQAEVQAQVNAVLAQNAILVAATYPGSSEWERDQVALRTAAINGTTLAVLPSGQPIRQLSSADLAALKGPAKASPPGLTLPIIGELSLQNPKALAAGAILLYLAVGGGGKRFKF